MAGDLATFSCLGLLASASALYSLRLRRGYNDHRVAQIAYNNQRDVVGSDRVPDGEAAGGLRRLCAGVPPLRSVIPLANYPSETTNLNGAG